MDFRREERSNTYDCFAVYFLLPSLERGRLLPLASILCRTFASEKRSNDLSSQSLSSHPIFLIFHSYFLLIILIFQAVVHQNESLASAPSPGQFLCLLCPWTGYIFSFSIEFLIINFLKLFSFDSKRFEELKEWVMDSSEFSHNFLYTKFMLRFSDFSKYCISDFFYQKFLHPPRIWWRVLVTARLCS